MKQVKVFFKLQKPLHKKGFILSLDHTPLGYVLLGIEDSRFTSELFEIAPNSQADFFIRDNRDIIQGQEWLLGLDNTENIKAFYNQPYKRLSGLSITHISNTQRDYAKNPELSILAKEAYMKFQNYKTWPSSKPTLKEKIGNWIYKIFFIEYIKI